jgi:ElaB/YqjD/DUF883 family membrane-anchored ribosome-binding protein
MDIFNSMSDMVADAEDLLRALGNSSDPELQMLRSRVESSIDEMKTNLRQRLKARAERAGGMTVSPWLIAAVAVVSAALLVGAITHRRD